MLQVGEDDCDKIKRLVEFPKEKLVLKRKVRLDRSLQHELLIGCFLSMALQKLEKLCKPDCSLQAIGADWLNKAARAPS